MAQQAARTAFSTTDLTVVADRGYFDGEQIRACDQMGITTFLPIVSILRDQAPVHYEQAAAAGPALGLPRELPHRNVPTGSASPSSPLPWLPGFDRRGITGHHRACRARDARMNLPDTVLDEAYAVFEEWGPKRRIPRNERLAKRLPLLTPGQIAWLLGRMAAAASVPLLLEYEAVLKRAATLWRARGTVEDIDVILDQLAATLQPAPVVHPNDRFRLERPFRFCGVVLNATCSDCP
jgi:hypothetical protein